jgi:HK97 family phage prohead protease
MQHEIRAGQPAEMRADGAAPRVAGYAAVFNEIADIGGMFRERIAPGAFRNAIGRDDVVFLVNHDGLPLARTRSGTLKLTEDDRGLLVESDLDGEDPDVRAILPKMRRGDLDKMSFAFRATVEEWDESGDMPLRTIKEVRLYDVSIVTEPAYSGTEIGLRGREQFRAASGASAGQLARARMKTRLIGV